MRYLIIGAGRTGRGFIAGLLSRSGRSVDFIDSDERLVRLLATEGRYRIRFYGGAPAPLTIEGFSVFHPSDPGAREAIRSANAIFVAVGAAHLDEVARLITAALPASTARELPAVVLCENGIGLAGRFTASLQTAAPLSVTQGVVFCTSDLDRESGALDLHSEDYPSLPIGRTDATTALEVITGIELVEDIDRELRRKIYTYNSLSAVLAYPGWLAGHSTLAQAAADPRLAPLVEGFRSEIDDALGRELGYTPADQAAYSKRALEKFSNPAIADTIERNIRDPARKLGAEERIVGSALLIRRSGGDAAALATTAAAALLYQRHLLAADDERAAAAVGRLLRQLPDPAFAARVEGELRRLEARRR